MILVILQCNSILIANFTLADQTFRKTEAPTTRAIDQINDEQNYETISWLLGNIHIIKCNAALLIIVSRILNRLKKSIFCARDDMPVSLFARK